MNLIDKVVVIFLFNACSCAYIISVTITYIAVLVIAVVQLTEVKYPQLYTILRRSIIVLSILLFLNQL